MPNISNEEDPAYDSASEASDSNDHDPSTSKSTDLSPNNRKPERDEVKEIERASKKDTNVIRAWRAMLILTLSATACAVTVVTYRNLQNAQTDAYKESVCDLKNCDLFMAQTSTCSLIRLLDHILSV